MFRANIITLHAVKWHGNWPSIGCLGDHIKFFKCLQLVEPSLSSYNLFVNDKEVFFGV